MRHRMKIVIKNVDAFRLAQTAVSTSKDGWRALRGVLARRDGKIAGTDGYSLVHADNVVEWEDSEEYGDSVILQCEKQIPKGVTDAAIDLHGDAGILHYRVARVTKAMAVILIKETNFPPLDKVLGGEPVTIVTNVNLCDPTIMTRLVNALPQRHAGQIPWNFRKYPNSEGVLAYMEPMPGCEAIVVPLKRGYDAYVAVPWIEEVPEGVSLNLPEGKLEEAA
jgi:hypothetical protein